MSQEIPDSTSNGGVSRRAVILGAIGAGVSAAMSVALPEPAVAASSSLTLTPLAHDTIGTPTGQVTEVPAFLGGLLTVAGSDVPARSVLTVTWDHRLFHLRDRPRLTDKAGAIVPCELRGKPSTTSTGMGQVSVIVTAPLRRGKEYVLNLGTGRSRRYPHDLIVDPHVGALTLGQAKTVEKPTAVPLRPAAGGGVWGQSSAQAGNR